MSLELKLKTIGKILADEHAHFLAIAICKHNKSGAHLHLFTETDMTEAERKIWERAYQRGFESAT